MQLEQALALATTLTKKQAWEITGGLSRTTKMPCHSWGIPASSCKTGSKLAKIPGTICNQCYALKGTYTWPTVERAYQRRLERADDPLWIPAMIRLVNWQADHNDEPYFRWFDSGDLQSTDMLERINTVAQATPSIGHWLPTRELTIVERARRQNEVAPNLCIRVSANRIGSNSGARGLPTSNVSTSAADAELCPAYEIKPASCGGCRACWDKKVDSITYPLH